MDVQQEKKVKRIINGVMIGLIAFVAVFVIYAVVSGNLNLALFEFVLGVFVVSYTLLTDVVEPYLLKQFVDLTIAQRQAYYKILAVDVVGVGALLYYVSSMDSEGNRGIIYILVYFLSSQMKRKFKTEFLGLAEEENEVEDVEMVENEIVDDLPTEESEEIEEEPEEPEESEESEESETPGEAGETVKA